MDNFTILLPGLLQILYWIALLCGGGYLLVRLVRSPERRGAAPAELAGLEARVRVLEEANTRLEADLAQLTDAQRFTTELLAERSTARSE